MNPRERGRYGVDQNGQVQDGNWCRSLLNTASVICEMLGSSSVAVQLEPLEKGLPQRNYFYIYSETCIRRNRMGPKMFSTLDKFPHYTK
jgi:hypothetical protein